MQLSPHDTSRGYTSHAVDAPRSATTFPAPQRQQFAPSSDHDRRPLPGQPHGHVGVLRDAAEFPSVNATDNYRPNEGREDMPPPVVNIAALVQPQDLQYVDMGYYMAHDYLQVPSQGHRDHIVGPNAGIVQDVPAQAPFAPPAPDIRAFNVDIQVQQAAVGPAPAFLDEVPYQGPVPNELAHDALRQLTLLYLNDPNSQVAMFHMEPSNGDEVTVDITLKLKLTNF